MPPLDKLIALNNSCSNITISWPDGSGGTILKHLSWPWSYELIGNKIVLKDSDGKECIVPLRADLLII